VTLGLTDRQFYRLTPRQLHLLLDRHREQVDHQELLTGIIAAAVYNSSMNRPKQPLSPKHFMPGYRRQRPERPHKQTRAEARAILMAHSINKPNA
jgi:hypothetical protein